jgi:ketosteroid isomerase-like protein
MRARSPEEIHDLIAVALNSGDRNGFAELHEEGATIVVPPDGRRVSGRAAIRSAVESVLDLHPTLHIELVEKLERDGLALTHGRWRLLGSHAGERIALSGRGTMVSRRQPDGSWQIVFDNPLSHA